MTARPPESVATTEEIRGWMQEYGPTIDWNSVHAAAYAAGKAAGHAARGEEDAEACEGEMVDADATGRETDYAYNLACQHCAAAIRAADGPEEK